MSVAPDDDGQRLDRWFKKHLPQVPYALMQKIVRKGQVRVDGKRAEPATRLSAGQDIRIPPLSAGRKEDEWFRPMAGDADYIRSLVIYDDGEILAINKPHGLASQGGMKIARHVDALLVHLEDGEGRRPKLIHRLDRDTSGVLLMARSREMAGKLGKLFTGRDVRKIYYALTLPAPEHDGGRIEMPLAKGSGADKDMILVNADEGKFAATEFAVLERAGKTAASVAFWPRTGRTHQIRVHAAAAGFPILGDEKYGPQAEEDKPAGFDHAPRLHLHAGRLVLPFPGRKEMLDLSAPLPDDLRRGWTALGFSVTLEPDPFPTVE